MSTRSNIYLKLKPESKGKTFSLNKELLKGTQPEGEENNDNFPIPDIEVPKTALFMRTYNHWDGYIEGVGEWLLNHYKTYDEVLNLLICGDTSSVIDRVISYRGWRNENTPPLFINKKTLIPRWKSYKKPRMVWKDVPVAKGSPLYLISELEKDTEYLKATNLTIKDGVIYEKKQVKVFGRYINKRVLDKEGALLSQHALCEEFAYLFDGEKWLVTYNEWDEATEKYIHHDWEDLAEVVAKLQAKHMESL